MFRKILSKICDVVAKKINNRKDLSGIPPEIGQDNAVIQKLREQTFSNTSIFSLEGIDTLARVLYVYDGDTMTLVIPLHDTFYKFSTRLQGIDTCEMKSKTEDIKKRAIRARNRVLTLIGAHPGTSSLDVQYTRNQIISMLTDTVCLVRVVCYKFEKYGRLLVEVYPSNSNESISATLLREQLAYEYDGGTKLSEEQQNSMMNM